ncbi:hypothetical protein [Corynebacterium variabile]|uniref:hypothetical protein n=1 Tax=Corynebacterium variabile TaxID=1727 RepID=UPI00264734BF|nr:hypothetical protein [Corynebacterium variabile]MDN6676771.1 hypothetical protein [Corynebacterium variabile]
MSDKFEDRLGEAIDEIMHYQTADDGRINTGELAATLIAQGIVADPVQHQQALVAIMDKQVRDSEGWRDEYCTHGVDDDGNEQQAVAWTTDHPEWERGVPVYHRKVTEWREVRRA